MLSGKGKWALLCAVLVGVLGVAGMTFRKLQVSAAPKTEPPAPASAQAAPTPPENPMFAGEVIEVPSGAPQNTNLVDASPGDADYLKSVAATEKDLLSIWDEAREKEAKTGFISHKHLNPIRESDDRKFLLTLYYHSDKGFWVRLPDLISQANGPVFGILQVDRAQRFVMFSPYSGSQDSNTYHFYYFDEQERLVLAVRESRFFGFGQSTGPINEVTRIVYRDGKVIQKTYELRELSDGKEKPINPKDGIFEYHTAYSFGTGVAACLKQCNGFNNDVQAIPPDFKVDAAAFLAEVTVMKGNIREIREDAKNRYAGKLIEITGIVGSSAKVTNSGKDEAFGYAAQRWSGAGEGCGATMRASLEPSSNYLNISVVDSQKESAARVRPWERVTVKGICSFELGFYPLIVEAVLVKK